MLKKIALTGLAAAAAVWVACGGEGPTGGATCTTDGDCLAGEICHPDAKVCVQTCESGNDCPDSAKNCEAITAGSGGADGGTTGGGTKICKCTTDQLCAGGSVGSTAICSTEFDICMTKCSANTDCPTGYDCETSTGQCVAQQQNNTCTPECAAHETCNNGTCEAVACTATAQQPSTCPYGTFCGGSNACSAVPAPTCMNFTTSGHGTSWSPTQATKGPVIYSLTSVSFGMDSSQCQNGNAARAKLRAYRVEGTWPSNLTNTPLRSELHYVKVDGSEAPDNEKPFIANNSTATVSSDGKHLEVDLVWCCTTCQNMFTGGLHFENGNEACVVVQ